MIGYYDRSGYKLLDRTTGTVFKSRDVIFKESWPHYSTDPIVSFPDAEIPLNPHPMVIAPRPKQTTQLHPMLPISTQLIPPSISTNSPTLALKPGPITPQTVLNHPDNEVSDTSMPGGDKPIAIRRSRKEIRPLARIKESLKYLSRPTASIVNTTTYDDNAILTTFNQEMKRPDLWMEPMLKELAVMKEKEVFHTVSRPIGKNVVKSKWVYANKYNDKGHIVARKAQLVAKDFMQILGEDYDETYTSVARLESVQLVCAIAALLGLRLWQVDFVSAFLNSKNTFEIYIEQPPGFDEGGDKV